MQIDGFRSGYNGTVIINVDCAGASVVNKMGNNLLVQEIDEAGGIDFSKPVLLGYSGLSDALLLKYIEDSRHI